MADKSCPGPIKIRLLKQPQLVLGANCESIDMDLFNCPAKPTHLVLNKDNLDSSSESSQLPWPENQRSKTSNTRRTKTNGQQNSSAATTKTINF